MTRPTRRPAPLVHYYARRAVAVVRRQFSRDVIAEQTRYTTIYVASGIPGGGQLAAAVASRIDSDIDRLVAIFGVQAPPNVRVYIRDMNGYLSGSGGAYHSGPTCYVDASLADTTITSALAVAEIAEAFMEVQGAGWNFAASNGEALSRCLAEFAYPDVLNLHYRTGCFWLDAPGRPDWISQTEPTDKDSVSTGCGSLFLWWLVSQGYSWPAIVRAGGSTLETTYQRLTGRSGGYAALRAVVDPVWPISLNPCGLLTDNPFVAPGVMSS